MIGKFKMIKVQLFYLHVQLCFEGYVIQNYFTFKMLVKKWINLVNSITDKIKFNIFSLIQVPVINYVKYLRLHLL